MLEKKLINKRRINSNLIARALYLKFESFFHGRDPLNEFFFLHIFFCDIRNAESVTHNSIPILTSNVTNKIIKKEYTKYVSKSSPIIKKKTTELLSYARKRLLYNPCDRTAFCGQGYCVSLSPREVFA